MPPILKEPELRLHHQRRLRSEEESANWRRERERNVKLVNNVPGSWENQTPVAGEGARDSTILVRNTHGMNARQEVNRLLPKEPRWVARPLAGMITENGLPVNNEQRASKLGAVTNIVAKGAGIFEELERCALDGEVGSAASLMVGYRGALGDLTKRTGIPDEADQQSFELSSASRKMAKRPGTLGISPWYPFWVRLDPTTVFWDYNAKTVREVNWVIRDFEATVEALRAEKVNKIVEEEVVEEVAPGVKRGSMVETVKTTGKYTIPSEITNEDNNGAPRRVKCHEEHYRVAAEDPDNSKDGSEWYILTWIEFPDTGKGLVCIRHDKYAFDLGGCAIDLYQANLTNDDLLGFVPGIRDSIQASRLFNTTVSMDVDWNLRNKTKRLYNPKHVDKLDIDNIAKAEAEDFIPVPLKGNATFDQAFGVLPANTIPDSLHQLEGMLGNLANEGSGRSENQRGNTNNTRTAAEAQIVAQETSAQVAAKQKRFRRFAESAMRKGMIILTHVMPEEGPIPGGLWEIPDPDNPGKFVQFGRKDLGAQAEIEIDLVSQVLKDDSVVVSQGLQLIDMAAKVLVAPPDVQRRVMPLFQRVTTAMGPDWEATGYEMFRTETDTSDPMFEHVAMLGGDQIEPQPNEDLQKHLDLHRAMLINGPRQHPDSWNRPLGEGIDPETGQPITITPAVLLYQHMRDTEGLMQQLGMKIHGAGAGPQNAPGSGPGSGRAPQAAPSSGEIAAGAENVGRPNTPGVRGAQAAG